MCSDLIEFIPIKPSVATGSGAPGSYAGHNRVPSPDRGYPVFTVTTRRGNATSQLEQQCMGVGIHPPWRHQYREKGAIHGAQMLEDRHGVGRTCRVAFGRVSV